MTTGSLFSPKVLHNYAWSGLHLRSRVILPELLGVGSGSTVAYPKVRIEARYAAPGTELAALSAESWLEARTEAVDLHVQNVATVHVRCDRIDLIVHPDARLKTLQSLICSAALGALGRLRGMITLHASAVATPRGAVLFVGPQQTGKTSLAACLSSLGAPMLADDPCALWLQGQRVVTAPCIAAPRPVGSELAAFMPTGSAPLRPVASSSGFDLRSVTRIFLLSRSNTQPAVNSAPLNTAEAIAGLTRNTYQPQVLEELARERFVFQRICKIVERVPVHPLELPSRMQELTDFGRALLTQIVMAPAQTPKTDAALLLAS